MGTCPASKPGGGITIKTSERHRQPPHATSHVSLNALIRIHAGHQREEARHCPAPDTDPQSVARRERRILPRMATAFGASNLPYAMRSISLFLGCLVSSLSISLSCSAAATAPGGPAGDPARLARIRGAKRPPIAHPVLFNTPEADALLAALEVFPADNPWNQLVTGWPVHPNSKAMVASVGENKPLRCNADMGFVLVPPEQKRVEVKIVDYPGESDPGPFPVPDNTPIEGWPVGYQGDAKWRSLSLDDVQRNKLNEDADRHAIVVDPANRMLYEFYHARKTATGWEAAQASTFDLKSNALRPTGWTSSDAAGLPIFPAVVRYDELKRGVVDHALRVTVRKTRREFVAPATHYASPHTDPSLPRMGERFRLRQNFDVSGFSPEVRVILTALKRYGMFVADNGIEWAISVAPDERIPPLHEELRRVKGADFEVVTPPR
jgi:hypothetical protein